MITHCETLISPSSKLSCSPTVTAFDASINKCVKNFKDLLSEYEQVLTELESCRNALSKQNDLCASKNCSAAVCLFKDLLSKENILQSVASALTQLNETRDWSYMEGIFRLLFGETTPAPPKQVSTGACLTESAVSKASPLKANTPNKKIIKKEKLTPIKQKTREKNVKLTFYTKDITIKEESPQKDLSSSLEDISFKDESISEIDGTPKAKSPVLENKRRKNQSVHSLLPSNSDNSDGGKRKGLETWKPDPKQQKTNVVLTPCSSKQNPTSSAKKKLTQRRFTSILMRNDDVVDLTSSPEFSGGTRGDSKGPVKSLIKTESSETEETILPSPTSNPTHEYTMFKPIKDKDSQSKFKKPLSLKHKNESTIDPKHETVPHPKDHKNEPKLLLNDTKNSENYQEDLKTDMKNVKNDLRDLKNDPKDFKNDSKDIVSMDHDPMENSIVVSYVPNKKSDGNCGDLETSVNILNPNRFKGPKKSPPKPNPAVAELNIDYDITHCDSFNDMKDDKENCRIENSTVIVKSPLKRPLGDNNIVSNIPEDADSSMSLLTRAEVNADKVKRRSPEKVEPVYKEPTVRKKAEKMALPAWLCEQCKAFTDALYDDPDPEKVKEIIQACGKHRGRRNPIRPKTPPGFWEVRWTVPEDTEEFNRKNNAS